MVYHVMETSSNSVVKVYKRHCSPHPPSSFPSLGKGCCQTRSRGYRIILGSTSIPKVAYPCLHDSSLSVDDKNSGRFLPFWKLFQSCNMLAASFGTFYRLDTHTEHWRFQGKIPSSLYHGTPGSSAHGHSGTNWSRSCSVTWHHLLAIYYQLHWWQNS